MVAEPAGVLSYQVYAVVYAVVTIRSEDDAGWTGAGAGFGAAGTATAAAAGAGIAAGTGRAAGALAAAFWAAAAAAFSGFLGGGGLAFSSALAFCGGCGGFCAFSAAARWEAPTSPDVVRPGAGAGFNPAPADAEDCASELGVPVTAPHADVASRTESMPAASRLFLRMENKASSWECGNGQSHRG